MNPISLVLKVISNLGELSGSLKDFEQSAKDLFAGKLSKAEVEQLISDVTKILATGLVTIPGVTTAQLTETLTGTENLVEDVIAAVSDVKTAGVADLVPDLSKAVADLTDAVTKGVIGLTDSTKEQILSVLAEIGKGI